VNDAVEQLSCQELVELVTDYLEGALPDRDRIRFEEHIGSCGGCTRYLEQMRATIRITGELTPGDLTPEAEQTLLDAFRKWKSASA
jgi:anti-sigma factor RsiW